MQLRVIALSAMGSNWEHLGFCRPHTQKQTQTRMCPHCVASHACLSSRSDHSTRRWHTHLMNHNYFDHGKNLNALNWSPMLGRKWYLILHLRSKAVKKTKDWESPLNVTCVVSQFTHSTWNVMLKYLRAYSQIPVLDLTGRACGGGARRGILQAKS